MAVIDKLYHTLLEKILKEGYWYNDPKRKGVKRLEIPSYTFRHELIHGFPILTTKKVNYHNVITELLWFLKGDTNIKYLLDNNCNIWNKDAYNHYCKEIIKRADLNPLSLEKYIDQIRKSGKMVHYGFEYGDLGNIYGHQWVKWGSNNKQISLVQPEPKLDPKYKPTYLGIASGKNKEGHFLSKTWEGMIARCYDKNNISYSLYGGKGVYVCNKWLSFEGFLEDVQLLDNFDKKVKDPKNYVLDKDGKGNGFIYSLETCQWITCEENTNLINNIEYTVEKENILYTFNNISKFCKQHNIDGRNFSDLWTKNVKSRYGFKFISKKDLNLGINQISNLIKNLREQPLATDHIVNSWNVGDLKDMALPPCHDYFQIIVKPFQEKERLKITDNFKADFIKDWRNKLNFKEQVNHEFLDKIGLPKYGFELHWHQRSVDTFLGLPYNIASYATLALIIEKLTGYKALAIQGDLKKVHLYDNSIKGVEEQLSRDSEKYIFNELEFDNPSYKSSTDWTKLDMDAFLDELYPEYFQIPYYESYPHIKVEMLERNETDSN